MRGNTHHKQSKTANKASKQSSNESNESKESSKDKQSRQAATKMYKIDQNLSLIIPRVFPKWVSEKKIVKVFHNQNIGLIYRVRIYKEVPNEKGLNKKGKKFPIYKAVIYFSHWYETDTARNFQQRLFEKNQARIVYDDPWYWTIFKNESHKLSKKDKRVIRSSQELYYTTLANAEKILANAEEILANAEEINEMKNLYYMQEASIKNCISELKSQNMQIQRLQEFCINHGLEIPFWDANHPPSADVTSLEAISAQTAVASSEFVLDYDDEKEYAEWVNMKEIEKTANAVAENALADFAEKNGYYEQNDAYGNQYRGNQYYGNQYYGNQYYGNQYYGYYDPSSACYAYNNSAECGFIRVPRYDDDEIASQYDTEMENEDRYSSSLYKWENRNDRMAD